MKSRFQEHLWQDIFLLKLVQREQKPWQTNVLDVIRLARSHAFRSIVTDLWISSQMLRNFTISRSYPTVTQGVLFEIEHMITMSPAVIHHVTICYLRVKKCGINSSLTPRKFHFLQSSTCQNPRFFVQLLTIWVMQMIR